MPDEPFVMLCQQQSADPSRAAGPAAGRTVLWSYAHVPHGHPGDVRPLIEAEVERHAPGFRDRILGAVDMRPADLEAWNPNLVGGDIIGGANDPLQVVMRPRIAADPYATGIPGVYIFSASTPPGAGVHGMCGHNAALSALRRLGP